MVNMEPKMKHKVRWGLPAALALPVLLLGLFALVKGNR